MPAHHLILLPLNVLQALRRDVIESLLQLSIPLVQIVVHRFDPVQRIRRPRRTCPLWLDLRILG